MRTAILFSGTAYNFPFSIESLNQNLVIPNNADVFIQTSRYNRRRWCRHTGGMFYNPADPTVWARKASTLIRDTTRPVTDAEVARIKSVFGERLAGIWFLEDMHEYRDFLSSERLKMKALANEFRAESLALNLPTPFGGSDITDPDDEGLRAVVDQYHHVQRCYEHMEEHERKNGFKYDYVMRARLDFVAPEPIIIEHYLLNHDIPYLFVCGSFRRDKFEWADEFCWFSKRNTAAILFPQLNQIGFIKDRSFNTTYKGNEYMFAPETQFSILLHKLKLSVVNVRIYRGSRYTRSPEDGHDYINYQFQRVLSDLEYEYQLVCTGPSDINEHLPILREYASKCEHVTELGTRYGNSTVAFMAARPKRFITYDVQWNAKIDYLKQIAADNGIPFEVKIENPQSIEPTDLLFIDTNHHVEQCSVELALHPPNVRKFLIFHDTTFFWEKGQGHEKGGGLRYAIEPFMAAHPEWKEVYRSEANNGLLILERQ